MIYNWNNNRNDPPPPLLCEEFRHSDPMKVPEPQIGHPCSTKRGVEVGGVRSVILMVISANMDSHRRA